MKKIILTLIGLSLILSSCDEQLDINQDPDFLTPADLQLNVELPVSITGVAATQGSYWALIGGIWSQYYAQSLSSSQYRQVDAYTLGTTDNLSIRGWTDIYDALLDIRNVKKNAEEQSNWNYYLITTVLETYASQMLVDWYGDIPYTEANNPDILQPAFDTGTAVYDMIITDIDDALGRDLSSSEGTPPAADDLVFGGDMDLWVQFANTLKLRIFLRQTEARPNIAQSGIEQMLNSGVSFLTTDAALSGFTDAPDISNPLYETDRRQLNTKLNLRASTTMHSFLSSNNDERIEAFYGPGNSLDQGDFNSLADPASISVADISPLTPIFFISAAQSYFMQAEAMERYKSGAGAKALYDAGVTAAFEKSPNFNDDSLAEDDQTWENIEFYDAAPYIANGGAYEYPIAGSFEEKLKAIITQKWVAGYPDNGAESFFEHNRTGYPVESAFDQQHPSYNAGDFAYSVTGVTGAGNFPQRLLYPNTETARNSNTPATIPITTPIWWNN